MEENDRYLWAALFFLAVAIVLMLMTGCDIPIGPKVGEDHAATTPLGIPLYGDYGAARDGFFADCDGAFLWAQGCWGITLAAEDVGVDVGNYWPHERQGKIYVKPDEDIGTLRHEFSHAVGYYALGKNEAWDGVGICGL